MWRFAAFLLLANVSAARPDDPPPLFPAGADPSTAVTREPALSRVARPASARPLGWPILRTGRDWPSARLGTPTTLPASMPPLAPSSPFRSGSDAFLPPVDLPPIRDFEFGDGGGIGGRPSLAPPLEPPAFAPDPADFDDFGALPNPLPSDFDGDPEPGDRKAAARRSDPSDRDLMDSPKLEAPKRRRPLLGLLRPFAGRDREPNATVPPARSPSDARRDPDEIDADDLRRRVEAEARRLSGRHLKQLEVRVVEDDILIRARPDWPWNRRRVRRDLESIRVSEGRRLLVEVE